jgi:hypothetical protein
VSTAGEIFVAQKARAVEKYGLQPGTENLGANSGAYPWTPTQSALFVVTWWHNKVSAAIGPETLKYDESLKKIADAYRHEYQPTAPQFLVKALRDVAGAAAIVRVSAFLNAEKYGSDDKFLQASYNVAFWDKIRDVASHFATQKFEYEAEKDLSENFSFSEEIGKNAAGLAEGAARVGASALQTAGEIVGGTAGGVIKGFVGELLIPIAVVGGGYVLLKTGGVV